MMTEIEKFNEKEANFIAKLILDRLKIATKCSSKVFNLSSKYKKVIFGIEELEETWFLKTSNNKHSFVRDG